MIPQQTQANQPPNPAMPPYMMYPGMMYPNMLPPNMFPNNMSYPQPGQMPAPPPSTAASVSTSARTVSDHQPPPPANNAPNYPPLNTATPRPLPDINVNAMYDTFSSMESGSGEVNTNTALKDMYGMMLHLFSKSAENDAFKNTVGKCVSRLDSIEAKIGGSDEPAIPLSIAIRFLPLPAPGQTDLQLVKAAFREIPAPGVDVERDCVKAVRLGDITQGKLGTVLVEMRNQECKGLIMKNKQELQKHANPGLQKLFIRNAQTKNEIKMNIALNQILQKIPGEENNYVAGNGRIMAKNQPGTSQHGRAPPQHGQHPHRQQPQPYRQQQPPRQQLYPQLPPQQPPFQFPNFNFQGYPFYPPPHGMLGYPQTGNPANTFPQYQPPPTTTATTLPSSAAPAEQTPVQTGAAQNSLQSPDIPVMEVESGTNQSQPQTVMTDQSGTPE